MGCLLISVHRHERGDNPLLELLEAVVKGPPPRAWGQPEGLLAGFATFRSTPTSVGTTRSSTWSAPTSAVHPHERGDNGGLCASHGLVYGPPPRAWGQPLTGLTAPVGSLVHPHERGDNEAEGR